ICRCAIPGDPPWAFDRVLVFASTLLSLLLRGGTAVAATVFLRPGIEFKSVERNPPIADWNHAHIRPHQLVEGVLVHPEIGGGEAQAQESWWERECHRESVDDFSF